MSAFFALPILRPAPVSAIPISPDKYFFDISYGTTIEDTLLFMGRPEMEKPTEYYVTAVGMRKIGEEHEREFYIPDAYDPAEPANWIELSVDKVTVSPAQEVRIPWTLTPSEYVGCGTNLAAIMVSEAPVPDDEIEGGAVTVEEQIISQIHLNILATRTGICADNASKLELVEFSVDKVVPIFNFDNVPLVTRIENTGNLIARDPEGYIEIFGFGPTITLPFNSDKLDVYPGTTRKFSNTWIDPEYPSDGTFWEQMWYELVHLRIGRYRARLGVTKNADPSIISTTHFWVLPWRVMLIILLLLIVGFRLWRSGRGGQKKK